MKSKTATSTFLSIEVRITSCTFGSAVSYWSESTPMASLPAAAAASNTPPPEPPAAW
jgi:hypothetical protein